jgi:hypothetical protein
MWWGRLVQADPRARKGNGTFLPGLVSPTGDRPEAVAASDLTGDGGPVLAVANHGSIVTALLNRP